MKSHWFGLWVFLILVLIFSLATVPISDPDFFMYLAVPDYFYENGDWPVIDPFIHSIQTYHWEIWHEWLGMIFYHSLYKVGGFRSVILSVGFFYSILFLSPLFQKNKKVLWPYFMLIGLAIYAGSFRFTPRTAIFGDAFSILTLFLLFRYRDNRGRVLYALPLIFLLWVNVHSSYLIGLAIFFVFLVFEIKSNDFKKMLLIFLLTAGASLCHIKGIFQAIYPIRFAIEYAPVLSTRINEWFPTWHASIRNILEIKTFFSLIALSFPFLLVGRKKDLLEIMLWVGFVYAGLRANRFIIISSIGILYIVIRLSDNLQLSIFKKKSILKSILVPSGVGIMLLIGSLFTGNNPGRIRPHKFGLGVNKTYFSDSVVDNVLELNGEGEIYNSFILGGYLAWKFKRKIKIFHHGFLTNFDFLDQSRTNLTKSVQHFNKISDFYNIKLFVISKQVHYPRLVNILLSHPRFELIYQDDSSLIFKR